MGETRKVGAPTGVRLYCQSYLRAFSRAFSTAGLICESTSTVGQVASRPNAGVPFAFR